MIVPFIILFQNAENSDFLDSQWLASAVAIAVTYIVFIMGMPALMFQTFIPESFRNIYNERFNWKWSNFFRQKLIIVIILFLISDGVISSLTSDLISSIIFGDEVCFEISGIPCTPKTVSDAILAAIIIGVIAYIQIRGYKHLLDNFKSTRNAAQQISDEIARHAIMIFDATGDVPQKDIEDLSVMAKELDSGQIKNQFLDSCESIVEHILASPLGVNKKDLIKLLMDSTICRSVLADGSRADGSNRRRVLKSLMTVHKFKSVKSFKPLKLTQREKKEVKSVLAQRIVQSSGSQRDTNSINDYFLQDIVGNYIRDIGLQSLKEGDDLTLNDAIEKLYTIDSDPMELFVLANSAVESEISHAYVAATGKLEAKVRMYLNIPSNISPDEHEEMRKFLIKRQRAVICITGIVARIFQKKGAAGEYALTVWKRIHQNLKQMDLELEVHFNNSYKHFFKATDFTTADSIASFRNYILPQK